MVHPDSVHGHGGAGRAGHLVGLVPDTWSRWCVADRSRVVPGTWSGWCLVLGQGWSCWCQALGQDSAWLTGQDG